MKKIITAGFAASLLMSGAQAADVTSDAGARIVAPLQIANTSALYFGTIAPSLTAKDDVTVSPDGAKLCGAALTCLTEDHTAAAFSVSGAEGQSYTISLPKKATIANGTGGEMTIDSFEGSKTNGTLLSGADSFTVGGNLAVGANQAVGDYKGSFVVTVEYQ